MVLDYYQTVQTMGDLKVCVAHILGKRVCILMWSDVFLYQYKIKHMNRISVYKLMAVRFYSVFIYINQQ